MSDYQELYDAVLDGDGKAAREITERALAEGCEALKLVQQYMMPAMDEVGRRFEEGDYFVPELLLAARAMKASLELVRPLLVAGGVEPAGKVVIGTVKGDLHDIGKNLVAALLEGGGYEVLDIGVNADPEKFVEAVRQSGARIVAMSALLTTTMPAMKTTIEALKQSGVRDQVKVMIGGAPTSLKYAHEIGADGYSESAAGAVGLVRSFG